MKKHIIFIGLFVVIMGIFFSIDYFNPNRLERIRRENSELVVGHIDRIEETKTKLDKKHNYLKIYFKEDLYKSRGYLISDKYKKDLEKAIDSPVQFRTHKDLYIKDIQYGQIFKLENLKYPKTFKAIAK